MASVLLLDVRCSWAHLHRLPPPPGQLFDPLLRKQKYRVRSESTPTVPAVFNNASYDNSDQTYGAERLLKRGVTAAQNGDRDEARKYLTQVVALDPESADAWMWLASISDYPEELLAFLNRVLAIEPSNTRAVEWHSATMSLMAKTFVKRAVTAHNDGNPDLAEQCIAQALEHDENCEDAWAWKASMSEDEDEQLHLLHRVLEINPENHEAADGVRQIEERRAEEARLEAERHTEEERLAAEAARLEEERRLEEQRRAEEEARLEEERRQEEARLEEERRKEEARVRAASYCGPLRRRQGICDGKRQRQRCKPR